MTVFLGLLVAVLVIAVPLAELLVLGHALVLVGVLVNGDVEVGTLEDMKGVKKRNGI